MRFPIYGQENSAPSTSVVNYIAVCANQTGSLSATEENVTIPLCAPMDVLYFYFEANAAPGSGDTFEYEVMKNGSDTALTITLTGTGSGQGVTWDHITSTVSFAEGDTISIRSTPGTGGAAPSTPGGIRWFLIAQNPDGQIQMGGSIGNAPSVSVTNYSVLFGLGASKWGTTQANVEVPAPCAGSYTRLRVRQTAAPGTGNTQAYALMLNGSASALEATVSGTGVTASDTDAGVAVVAGDTVSVRSVPNSTPASATNVGYSLLFVPTTDGDAFFGFAHNNNPSNTVDNFEIPLGNGANAWNATESTVDELVFGGDWRFTAVRGKLSAAPSAGKSRSLTLRAGPAGSIADGPSLTIADAATTGSGTGSLVTALGDRITVRNSNVNTPTAGHVKFGFLVRHAVVSGSAEASLGGLTATATGSKLVSGAAAGALGSLTATAIGQKLVSGAAAADLGGLTGTGTGSKLVSGVAVAAFGSLTASGVGQKLVSGAAIAAFSFSATGVGTVTSGGELVSGTALAAFGALGASASGWVAHERAISGNLGLTDSASRSASYALSLSESIGLSDSMSHLMTYIRSHSESIGLSDDAAGVIILLRTISDDINLSETFLSESTISRSISENLDLSDLMSAILGLLPVEINDTIGLVDDISVIIGLTREILDSLGVTDDVVALKTTYFVIQDLLSTYDLTVNADLWQGVLVDLEFALRELNAFIRVRELRMIVSSREAQTVIVSGDGLAIDSRT